MLNATLVRRALHDRQPQASPTVDSREECWRKPALCQPSADAAGQIMPIILARAAGSRSALVRLPAEQWRLVPIAPIAITSR